MEGRATPTIDTSRPSRKSTPHSRIRAPQVRASQRWLTCGEAGEEEAMPGIIHARAINVDTRIVFANVDPDRYTAPVSSTAADSGSLVAAWRQVMESHARVTCALEKALQRE